MGLLAKVSCWIRGDQPTVVDFDAYEPDAGTKQPGSWPTGKTGPEPDKYKMQQSYDSLTSTVRELREALDGQARRQDELISKLSSLPQAVETLPQTSKIQADMLALINDRIQMHSEQQKKVTAAIAKLGAPSPTPNTSAAGNTGDAATRGSTTGAAKAQLNDALQAIREQIETGNEIDRQLVDSFNRFSLMIDRLHMANNHAVECLQQVRESYAVSAMQMQEWIEKSRRRHNWMLAGAFLMSLFSLIAFFVMLIIILQPSTLNP